MAVWSVGASVPFHKAHVMSLHPHEECPLSLKNKIGSVAWALFDAVHPLLSLKALSEFCLLMTLGFIPLCVGGWGGGGGASPNLVLGTAATAHTVQEPPQLGRTG